jgi:ATP-dependent RNA helicase RhlE
MTFAELGLSPEVLKAVEELGYASPTPIQAKAIPVVLGGSDVLAAAQTGTGKTAAFTLPLLSRLRAHANNSASPAMHPVRARIPSTVLDPVCAALSWNTSSAPPRPSPMNMSW